MPASGGRRLCCTSLAHQSGEQFVNQFRLYVACNFVIALGYAAEAVTNILASAVAVAFFLDAALLAWLASFAERRFGTRKLQCITRSSIAASIVSLIAAVGLQGYSLWLADFGGGLSAVLWEQGPAVLAFTLFVCIFKTLTLPAANSFRLWRTSGKTNRRGMSATWSQRSRAPPALPMLQESPADHLVAQKAPTGSSSEASTP